MSAINIFKLDSYHEKDFKSELINLNCIGMDDRNYEGTSINCELYISFEKKKKELSWNWVAKEFSEELDKSESVPKGLLILKKENNTYVCSFGHAYFLIDKYCDRSFALEFAKRIKISKIKTTTQISPHSQRNKHISSYVDYKYLEFDSGESFSKMKFNLSDQTYKDLISQNIEIGTSIRMNMKKDSIDNVLRIIEFVEDTLEKEIINKIPYFNIVKDKKMIEYLEEKLCTRVFEGKFNINISELDIYGTKEIFNNTDEKCKIYYGQYKKEVDELTEETLESFAKEKNFDFKSNVLNIKVNRFVEGNSVRTDSIHDMIEYTDDEEKCLLIKGKWYKYDDYYIELIKSISFLPFWAV